MKILSNIVNIISNNINNINNITYKPNYNYLESTDANKTFPEVGNINIFNIVDKPPKNSSSQTKKEIEQISYLTNNRTLDQIKLVYAVDEDPMVLFDPVIQKLDLIFQYHKFDIIYWNILLPIIDHLKAYYNRARPYQIAQYYNTKIDTIITKTHHTPSYPSGHTMYAALIGKILTSVYPEKRTIFEDIVREVGRVRVLQGVHYPSDNDASIKIMNIIYPQLNKYYMKMS